MTKVKLENKDGKVENLPGLSVEDGSCIFPFLFQEQLRNECYKGKKGSWCATKVSKKTKKIKKWAYCQDEQKTKKSSLEQVDTKHRVPKDSKIQPDSYVLPNRKGFINWFDTSFRDYRVKDTKGLKKGAKFTFFNHQKIIKDYLDTNSPYRGLLLYHGLGVGKTCGSIGIAEGFRTDRNIVVLLNKSLRQNFVENLKKCGYDFFRIHQHWFFHTFSGKDDIMKKYAKFLRIPLKREAKGAWFINFEAEPNYEKLSAKDQEGVDEQISKMIDSKYKFYNLDGLNEKALVKMKENRAFDNCVLIIDEVHNLTNAMSKGSPGVRAKYLEEIIMDAQEIKCVFLSGTPMINNLFETAKLFNLLRGKIASYLIKFPTNTNWAKVEDTLKYHRAIDQVIIRKKESTVSVTRVPNYYVKSDTFKLIFDPNENDETDKEFKDIIEKALPEATNVSLEYYNALPNDEEKFMRLFYDKTKETVKNMELYKSRILGMVSFYKTQNKDLLPTVRTNEVIEVPMSEYMFIKYAAVRKDEIKMQKQKHGKKTQKKKGDGETPFEVKSSYRAYSRMHCSFVFPETIERPTPSGSLEDYYELEDEIDENIADKNRDKIYEKKRLEALEELENNADTYLLLDDKDKLPKYSPKYNLILKKIEEVKGLSFVYTEYKTMEGIAVLSICLRANGYDEFRLIKNSKDEYILPKDLDLKKPRFAFWASSDEQSELIRKIYNNELGDLPKTLKDDIDSLGVNNLRGALIKVLLTTRTGAEGIDLKNVRQVHIMEPYWNPVRLDQVKGRAVRVNSHIELPKSERLVDIYTYISTMDPKMRKTDPMIDRDGNTSDEALFELSEKKRSVINGFLKMIKEASIDCSLNFKDTYDAEDPFVCLNYGSSSMKDYSFVPNIYEQSEDKDRFRKVKQISWKPKVVNVPNKGKFALKPAPPDEPQLLFDLEMIKESGRPGEPLGEIIRTKNNKQAIKFY